MVVCIREVVVVLVCGFDIVSFKGIFILVFLVVFSFEVCEVFVVFSIRV